MNFSHGHIAPDPLTTKDPFENVIKLNDIMQIEGNVSTNALIIGLRTKGDLLSKLHNM